MNEIIDFLRCRLVYLLGGTPNTHLEALNVQPVIEPKPKFKTFTPIKKQKIRSIKSKQLFCPVMDKVSMVEAMAKARAAQFNTYMRAYKCEFCPYWHLTHRKTYL